MFLKRSDCLVFFFQAGKLHLKNYLTGSEAEALPQLVSMLAKLDRWRTLRGIERLFPELSPPWVRRFIRRFVAHSAVVVRGGSQARREAELSSWEKWGVEARFFHFATRNLHSVPITVDDARFHQALKRRRPPPSSVKKYMVQPRVALPNPELHGAFAQILLQRRTHRRFGADPVSLEQLSTLLYLTWGFTGQIRWPGLGRLPVKTSPSGGARHSLEAYLWCSRVIGLRPGVYHYRPDRHDLEVLKLGKFAKRMAQLCGYQNWVQRCSALFVMTSVLERVMWRYPYSRAYRVIQLEAGHFCQTFCLAATWLGLAPFCTAALHDEKIEVDLGLHAGEAVIYAAGVGTLPA